MQIPGGNHRRTHIVAPLNNGRGNMAYIVYIVDQKLVTLEKPFINKVVAFDAGESHGKRL